MIKNACIVIACSLPWEWSADYQNQTAYELGAHNLVVCFFWDTAPSLRKIIVERKKHTVLHKLSKNLYLFSGIQIVPFMRFGIIRRINLWLNVQALKAIVATLGNSRGFHKKMVWVFDPRQEPVVRFFGQTYLSLYDCVDYFPGSGNTMTETKNLIKEEDALLSRATVVVANSQVLLSRLQKKRADATLVPQGFRLDVFQKPAVSPIKVSRSTPVVGYIGAINYRIDYTLLTSLAKRNPNLTFVLVGPIHEGGPGGVFGANMREHIDRLRSLPNVSLYPSARKKSIASTIKQFDIGMIPYDTRLDFNRFCYPMKLFEYFYMGKPVIATPIEELKRFPKYVKMGSTLKEWERHIHDLLARPWPKEYQKEQRLLAEENSWERKVESVSRIVVGKPRRGALVKKYIII